jgi:hypothetical protein
LRFNFESEDDPPWAAALDLAYVLEGEPMPENEDESPRPGLIIRNNICIGNSGAGISVPGRFVSRLEGNYSLNNPGIGIELTDEYTTLLQSMQLHRDTPVEILAAAIAVLRDVPLDNEITTRAAIDGSGLTKWISASVQSLLQFAANMLVVVNSPQGRAVLGKLLG